jgi:hypothetical protein
MDMDHGLERMIANAEAQKAEVAVASWDCGDGANMGSFMIKNTEWSRALMERIKDMRVVWHHYFFHSATGNTEQGAFWTLMAADPEWPKKMYSPPPRAINCRHSAIECAGDREKVGRVYYHKGDFMIHYAALIRGDVGMALFLDSMSKTGWWPCSKEKCTEELLQTALRAGKKKPIAGSEGNDIVLVVADNSTASTSLEAMRQLAQSKSLRLEKFSNDFYFFSGNSICVGASYLNLPETCTEAIAQQTTWTHLAKGAKSEIQDYGTMATIYRNVVTVLPGGGTEKEFESPWANGEVNEGLIFTAAGGWSKISSTRAVLTQLATQMNPKQQWVLIAGADSAASLAAGSSLLQTIAVLTSSGDSEESARIAVQRDCRGPWLIKAGEWGRILMRRAADSWMLRQARIQGKSSSHIDERKAEDYVNPNESPEETADAAQALCMLLKRDSSVTKYTKWLS